MENLESRGVHYFNFQAGPGRSWNLSKGNESHGKAMCFLRIERQECRGRQKFEKNIRRVKQALISVQISTSIHFIPYNAGKYVDQTIVLILL